MFQLGHKNAILLFYRHFDISVHYFNSLMDIVYKFLHFLLLRQFIDAEGLMPT